MTFWHKLTCFCYPLSPPRAGKRPENVLCDGRTGEAFATSYHIMQSTSAQNAAWTVWRRPAIMAGTPGS